MYFYIVSSFLFKDRLFYFILAEQLSGKAHGSSELYSTAAYVTDRSAVFQLLLIYVLFISELKLVTFFMFWVFLVLHIIL